MKICIKCKTEKSDEEFNFNVKNSDFLQSWCRACKMLRHHGYEIRRKFGVTIQWFENILKRQNGVCAICKKQCTSGRNLAVDHDHKTNKVRGLLCIKCNNGLGAFEDDIELLQRAMEYLKSWASK